MSVINQMLRDLDARQASKQERDALPAKLRNLPPLRGPQSKSWRLLAGGMVAGAALAWLVVSLLAVPSPMAPPPPVAAVPPAPTLAAPTTIEAPSAAPSPVVANDPAPVQPAAEPADMKIETSLGHAKRPEPMPEKAPKVVEAPAKVVEKIPVEPRNEAAPVPALRAAPSIALTGPSVSIDKKTRNGQTRESAEAEYLKGMQALKYGDNAGAMQSLRRTLELDPSLAKARQALLSLLVGGKQWDEAQQVVQSGLALDPTKSGWALILARLQFELGDTPAALETLGHYAVHAGADADYQGFFAYLLQKQQRPAEAAGRFHAALALRPSEGRWWFGLGLALEGAGKRGEAKEAYAKAREVGNLPPDMAQVIEQRLR